MQVIGILFRDSGQHLGMMIRRPGQKDLFHTSTLFWRAFIHNLTWYHNRHQEKVSVCIPCCQNPIPGLWEHECNHESGIGPIRNGLIWMLPAFHPAGKNNWNVMKKFANKAVSISPVLESKALNVKCIQTLQRNMEWGTCFVKLLFADLFHFKTVFYIVRAQGQNALANKKAQDISINQL